MSNLTLVDTQAEREYIGGLIPDGERYLPRFGVPATAFFDTRHATLAATIEELYTARRTLCATELVARLQETGRVLIAGGLEYVYSLCTGETTHVPEISRRLIALSSARNLRNGLLKAVAEIENFATQAGVEIARDALEKLNQTSVKIESIYATAHHAFTEISGEISSLIPTGIKAIDAHVGGLAPGSLTIIGADTGVGKSSVALYLAHTLDGLGIGTGYVSCEDPRDVMGPRAIAMRGNISALRIRTRDLNAAEYTSAANGVDAWRDSKAHIAYEIGSTERDVMGSMARLVNDHGAKIVYVDYVQTINPANGSGSRREDVRVIASKLKSEACRLGVPIVLLSQIARPKEGDNIPGKHALKESGDLENMAELILMLWKDATNQTVFGRVAKSKWGGDGLQFDLKRGPNGMLREAF